MNKNAEVYIQLLKEKVEAYKEFSTLCDEAEEKMLKNPLDEKAEYLFDVYYGKQYNAMCEAVKIISLLTKLDERSSRELFCKKNTEIIELVSKIA